MKRLLSVLLSIIACLPSHSFEWKARWITAEHENGTPNTWMAFRKTVELPAVPSEVEACICADSKYWMWINGTMVVREGGLKRGPAPGDGYFDRVQIAPFLKEGSNVIAVLVDYFGKSGFSHMSSGIPGLLFEARGEGVEILSDRSWEVKRQDAYGLVPGEQCNYRLPESNVRFDAREWDGSWINGGPKMGRHAVVFPSAPDSAPFGRLVERPIPFWKDYGLQDYMNVRRQGDTLVCTLPFNAHFSPYLKVSAPSGRVIGLRTDHSDVYGAGCVVGEYVTRDGVQEYEHLSWMNGQYMYYILPAGVEVLDVKYRQTGYDAEFTGYFHCDDPILNEYWQKSVRTLYTCMRDTYMDCPDRERAQWWGDEVHELAEAFYALSPSSWALARKGIYELCAWAASDGVLYAPIPCSNYFKELPQQILAAVGWYGFRQFSYYSADTPIIRDVYPAVHRYLHEVWTLDENGLPEYRAGGWDWADAGNNIDSHATLVPWFYLALKAEKEFAQFLGRKKDAAEDEALMNRIYESYNRLYWNGSDYRSPGFEGPADDRAQAAAVISGLCSEDKYKTVCSVLSKSKFSSTYYFRYVLEAFCKMGRVDLAQERMHEFCPTIMRSDYSTLWEHWDYHGSSNHAWSGNGIVVMMEEFAGIKPLEPGFNRFTVNPKMGNLKEIDAIFDTAQGTISVSLRRAQHKAPYHIDAIITVPYGTTAVVNDYRGQTLELGPGTNLVQM